MEYDTLVDRVAWAQINLDRLSKTSSNVFDSYNQFISGGVWGDEPLDMPPLEEVEKIVRSVMAARYLASYLYDVLVDVALQWDEIFYDMSGETKS